MEKAVSWKKILIFAIAVCLFAGIIVKCNQFQKTPLASYKGQKYEKAVVTKIIKDNLAEDGSRYGTQKVLVKMTTGTYKGKEKQAINPSGTLFGADCKVGARIIVIVNKSGTNVGFTVYSQDRTMAIYGFVLIFAAVVCAIGREERRLCYFESCICVCMYHWYHVPDDVSGNFTDRVDDHCSSVDNDCNIRTSWWIFEQNSVCDPWNSDRSRDRSSGSDGIWKSSRDHRI